MFCCYGAIVHVLTCWLVLVSGSVDSLVSGFEAQMVVFLGSHCFLQHLADLISTKNNITQQWHGCAVPYPLPSSDQSFLISPFARRQYWTGCGWKPALILNPAIFFFGVLYPTSLVILQIFSLFLVCSPLVSRFEAQITILSHSQNLRVLLSIWERD